jgi:ribonuclease HII
MVTLELELAEGGTVAGVDEAGRGPLAGGVYAAAVSVPLDLAPSLLAGSWSAINDSKKLSERRREELAQVIKSTEGCVWAVASASPAEIDRLNILRATHLAMKRAVDEVRAAFGGESLRVLVDGLPVPTLENSRNVIKGDAKSLFIAAASILAKTARDEDCLRLDALYPQYGFARHKGYPTKAHFAALAEFGPCPEHRMSFGPVAQRDLFETVQ